MDKLQKILNEIRPDFDFMASNDFINDGMLDSFDIVLLVSRLEEFFDISINGFDIVPENFRNLKSIEDLVKKSGGIL